MYDPNQPTSLPRLRTIKDDEKGRICARCAEHAPKPESGPSYATRIDADIYRECGYPEYADAILKGTAAASWRPADCINTGQAIITESDEDGSSIVLIRASQFPGWEEETVPSCDEMESILLKDTITALQALIDSGGKHAAKGRKALAALHEVSLSSTGRSKHHA